MRRFACRDAARTVLVLAAIGAGCDETNGRNAGDGGAAFAGSYPTPQDGPTLPQPTTVDASADDGANADGAPPDVTGAPNQSCSDLFDQDVLQTYSIDISAGEWAKLDAEFHNTANASSDDQTYHPITFHFGSETVTDAQIRLKGQSSWVQTIQYDEPHPKMQFDVSFDETVTTKTFHGVSKLVFDMPREDATFLHQRLANTWLRQLGIMAPCANSARVIINGSYYGVYVSQEGVGHHLLKQFFPLDPDGDLLKGGTIQQTNRYAPNRARKAAFWAATTIPAMLKVIDLPHSVLEWAAEALLNDGDGYYSGAHNFLVYDQGPTSTLGWVWLPTDMDSTIDYVGRADIQPICWWVDRGSASDPPGPHYLAVMSDDTWRGRYVDAIDTQLQHWDVAEFQSRIDTWSAQIADAVNADPHKGVTFDAFRRAVANARKIVSDRPKYLENFVKCYRSGGQGNDCGRYIIADCPSPRSPPTTTTAQPPSADAGTTSRD